MKKAYLDFLYKERENIEREINSRKSTHETIKESFMVNMFAKSEMASLELFLQHVDFSIKKYIEIHAPDL